MEIATDRESLERYVTRVTQPSPRHPVLIDKYLDGKEVEVDAISDGSEALIPGIMEHIERAGVHSGDSMAVYPAMDISDSARQKIIEHTQNICRAIDARGLVNIQYVIWRDEVYVIEVNPRASRTVPFLSKVTWRAHGSARDQRDARQDPARSRLRGRAVSESRPRRDQGPRLLDVQAVGSRYVSRP